MNVLRILVFLLITSSIWLCLEIFHGQARSESCTVSKIHENTGIVENITDCVVFFKENNDIDDSKRVLLDLTPYWIMPQKCGNSILCYDGSVFGGSTGGDLPGYHRQISDLKSKINKVEDFFSNACGASKCAVVAAYKEVNEGCSEIGTFLFWFELTGLKMRKGSTYRLFVRYLQVVGFRGAKWKALYL